MNNISEEGLQIATGCNIQPAVWKQTGLWLLLVLTRKSAVYKLGCCCCCCCNLCKQDKLCGMHASHVATTWFASKMTATLGCMLQTSLLNVASTKKNSITWKCVQIVIAHCQSKKLQQKWKMSKNVDCWRGTAHIHALGWSNPEGIATAVRNFIRQSTRHGCHPVKT